MSAHCASCFAEIRENSAVMVRSGLVYHQRCAPGSPRPAARPDQPLTTGNAVGMLIQWAAWAIIGVVVIAAAVAFWPIALAVLALVAVINYAAKEFARANRR